MWVSVLQAQSAEFRAYQEQVMSNAKAMAEALTGKGYTLISGQIYMYYVLYIYIYPAYTCIVSGHPAVMENLEKAYFLPGQGKVRDFCKKSWKNGKNKQTGLPAVREKSGNFTKSQGIL